MEPSINAFQMQAARMPLHRSAQRLEGTAIDSVGDARPWQGVRAPKLNRPSATHWGHPIKLFSGTVLTGWPMKDGNLAGAWKVENGTLISTGHGSELIGNASFEDFKLHAEFTCGPSSNSGIWGRSPSGIL
jgi:Domain of Unknown Function (DUF1080)